MRIDVLTLFPEIFTGFLQASILGKAVQRGLVAINLVNYREFSQNKHGTVDDTPYGGGQGMVLKVEPIYYALFHLLGFPPDGPSVRRLVPSTRVILLCPQGETYTQAKAEELATASRLILICGHYEGYDERIRQHLITDEISLGDFVLTGGEIPAMALIDSVVRLCPGVVGNPASLAEESYVSGLLEYPQYTRPAVFQGWPVPDVLLSGHHGQIERWRRKESLRRTLERRPDLLAKRVLSPLEQALLDEIRRENQREHNPFEDR
jgi:tRNA (guanine37-N1)-methyltransferase